MTWWTSKTFKKPYKNILFYYIGYVTFKDLRYVKINNINQLYLFIGKINWYFEVISGNKYLTLVPNKESTEIMKMYEEQNKIRDIRSITNNSYNF